MNREEVAEVVHGVLEADNPGYVTRDLCDERTRNIQACVREIKWTLRTMLVVSFGVLIRLLT